MKQQAVMHGIGQMMDMRYGGVGAGDVSRWLGVSKPTAFKFLRKMVDRDLIYERKNTWRGSMTVFQYVLTESTFRMYRKGEFKASHKRFFSSNYSEKLTQGKLL